MKRWLGGMLVLLLALAGAAGTLRAAPSDEEKIETVIAAVMEAYQTGNYDAMGKYYAADVTMVPSDYGPPIKGWGTVKQRYLEAAASFGGVEMARENTMIQRRGKVAWAVYQWKFAAIANGQPVGALGHTTLILEKRGGDWVIVHNHSSALPGAPEPAPATPEQPPADQD